MTRQSHPDLGQISARIAVNNARVNRLVESLPNEGDSLSGLAQYAKPFEAPRSGRRIVTSGNQHTFDGPVHDELAARAEKVLQALEASGPRQSVPRGLVRMIGVVSGGIHPRSHSSRS
jgi:hypothetical protein